MNDDRPFRVPSSSDKKPPTPPEPEEPVEEESPEEIPPVRPAPPKRIQLPEWEGTPPWRRFFIPGIAVLVVIVLLVVGGIIISSLNKGGLGIDTSKYQAVFLTNGQVYFGKLQAFNDDSMKMTEIYYLQAKEDESADSENPQKTATDQNNVQLIKLGNEIHGPEDTMIVLKDQILFYENLKNDSNVVKSIQQFKSAN